MNFIELCIDTGSGVSLIRMLASEGGKRVVSSEIKRHNIYFSRVRYTKTKYLFVPDAYSKQGRGNPYKTVMETDLRF